MDFSELTVLANQIIDSSSADNLAIKIGSLDKVLYERYFSVGDALDERTMFDMASVTKILATGTLCLQAMDQGLIHTDDSVGRFFYLPDDKSEMKIFHLLTHTMGIGHKHLDVEGVNYENVADYILSIPADVEIGTKVLYSCPGFILLGKILEKVYGERLNVLFRERVCKPLGMTDTDFGSQKANTVNSNPSEDMRGIVNDYNCRYLGGICGNAGVYSNVRDLTCFAHMMLRGGSPILSEQVYRLAVKNYTAHMDTSRGLAFMYADARYPQTSALFKGDGVGHAGHTGQSLFVGKENGIYVIILSDATKKASEKLGRNYYDSVKVMRSDLHSAIKAGLGADFG